MIKIENLNYVYKKSGIKAVKNISFEIENGEIFGFLGPSGAGKTTTQKLIIGLLSDYRGNIIILGKERQKWDSDFFERIGVAFDFPNLYLKLTASENLNLIANYYKNESNNIDELFEMVGLERYKNKKVESFSKGMKMRLNFIRSIMHDPDILFFDEPTSGLDPVNAKIIKNTILQLKEEGKTIFLTTHNMTVAEQICDRVAFINEGEISAIDTPENLMVEHGQSLVDVSYIDNGKKSLSIFKIEELGRDLEFLDIVKNKKIIKIHSKEATLEDVFIKYTGRNLSC